MKPYIHNYLSQCVHHPTNPPSAFEMQIAEGRKGGVDARQQSYFVGRLDDARQEESTDRRLCVTTGKKQNANRGQRRDNGGSIKEGNRVMMMCFPGKSLLMDLME